MNAKLSIQKLSEKRLPFPKLYMVLSAVASFGLWLAWGLTLPGLNVTMPDFEFTLAIEPKYFPEAPLWHIGLYVCAYLTMAYPIFGLIDRVINRKARNKSVQAK